MARSSTIQVRILGDNSGLKGALNDSQSEVGKWAGKVGKLAAAGLAAAGAAAAAGIGASIKQAVDLGESINAVEVTFGDAASGIKRLGEEAATAVGLSNAEFNGLAVQFSSFATRVAGPGGDVVQTIDDMTTRAADFASVMNLDVAEAASIFQSGLAGETEPLKRFGIDLSAAAVEAYALANGIHDGTGEMTEAQKVQARYGLLMAETAKTQGDFANTSDSLANRQRVLMATVKNLGARIGTALLPMLTSVATVIADKLVPWLERNLPAAIEVVQNVIGTVVAYIQRHWGTVTAVFEATIDVVQDVVSFFQNNQPALIGLIAAIAVGLGAWAISAGAAAVATIAALAPFIAAAAAIGALVAAVVYAYREWDAFRVAVDTVRAWLVDTLWPAIQQVAQGVADAFSATVEWVRTHWDTIKAVIETAINTVKAIIETVIDAIQVAWQLWGDELVAYIETAWDTISGVVQAAIDIVRGIIQSVTALIRGDWDGFWDGIKTSLSGVWEGIQTIVSGALDALELLISAAWDGMKELVSAGVDALIDAVADLPSGIAGVAAGAFDSIWTSFKAVINRVIDAWNSLELPGFTIPGFDPPGPGSIPGITIPSFGVPNIPRLATGGVMTSPTFALLGEYAGARSNPEIVSPQSMMADTMRSVLGETGRQSVGLQINGDVRLDDLGVEELSRSVMFALQAA